MRILFMGSGDLACPALSRLLDRPGDEVVAVVSQPDRPKGRNRRVAPCPAKAFAEARGIPVFTPERIGAPTAVTEVAGLHPDLITVVAYGQYIKPEILAIPPLGAINVHPSLLPKYRGASPIQWALANGESTTGVTILYVSKAMDAGDIILQQSVPIDPDDTAGSLSPRLAELGGELLVTAIEQIANGTATRTPQDETQATIVYKLSKEDGRIDWQQPAETIRNRIRGFTPWPGCYTDVQGKMLKVTAADVIAGEGSHEPGTVIDCLPEGPVIATGADALLLREVQPEGRKPMSGSAYLCGHAIRPGARVGLSEPLPDNPTE